MDVDLIESAFRGVVEGKRWIITPDAAAGATRLVERLKNLGAEAVMVIAGTEGVGDLPKADAFHYTRTGGTSMMTGIREFVASVANPSEAMVHAIDRFDPDGEAIVLAMGYIRIGGLAGRRLYGARPPSWAELEDKTTADALFADAGVATAPHEVVPVREAADAHRRLRGPLGSVWVADNKEGWHGGGEYVRWVKTDEQIGPMTDWFDAHADLVRVMPFLDGIPSSIHGFVTHNGVAVFLPIEMTILRTVEEPGFYYARGSNFWTPPDEVTETMRVAARSIGALIHDRMGYLGGFGIDGVCTEDGWFPTEINPRMSLGHFLQGEAADMPLSTMERTLLEGDVEVDAAALEDAVVSAVATSRHGGMMFPLDETHESDSLRFVFDDERARVVDEDEEADGAMFIGPSAFGAVILVRLEPSRIPIGPSIAPRALPIIELARSRWGVEIPEVAHAPDLCRGGGEST